MSFTYRASRPIGLPRILWIDLSDFWARFVLPLLRGAR